MALALPGLLGLLGCNGALSPQAKEILLAGYAAYEKQDDQETIRHMDVFLKDHSKARAADQAYYLRGLARYRLRDYDNAKTDLLDALRRAQTQELRGKAALALGDLGYHREDMPAAESMYRRALENLKQDQPPADHALYRLGRTLQRLGRWSEADQQFDRLIYLFEGSELAALAARWTHAAAWTIQVAAFNDKLRAEAAARRLRADNEPAAVRAVLQDGKAVFVVQVGQYADYDRARQELERVRKRYSADACIMPTR